MNNIDKRLLDLNFNRTYAKDKNRTFKMRISEQDKESWMHAAAAYGVTTSELIRIIMNESEQVRLYG